jgi:hypothetical protein
MDGDMFPPQEASRFAAAHPRSSLYSCWTSQAGFIKLTAASFSKEFSGTIGVRHYSHA